MVGNRLTQMVARHPRRLVAGMLLLAAACWVSVGATALFAHQLLDGVPDKRSLGRVTEMARSSVFYDVKGRPAFTIFKEQRIEVPLDQMSPHLKQAILAIEDQRFYEHRGVDVDPRRAAPPSRICANGARRRARARSRSSSPA